MCGLTSLPGYPKTLFPSLNDLKHLTLNNAPASFLCSFAMADDVMYKSPKSCPPNVTEVKFSASGKSRQPKTFPGPPDFEGSTSKTFMQM